MNHLIFDIETLAIPVPDSTKAEWRKEIAEEYVKEDTILKKLEAKIERAKYDFDGCRPIALSACLILGGGEKVFSSIVHEDSTEVAKHFHALCQDYAPVKLVGYNIKGFDLPILYRWMALADLKFRTKIGRYDIIDLMDHVSGFGKKVSLDRACTAYGIKCSEYDGSFVDPWYRAKDWHRIEAYCVADVQCTLELYEALTRFQNL